MGFDGVLLLLDGCLLVGNSAGDEVLMVWPSPGTTWLPLNQVLIVDGKRIAVGDTALFYIGDYTPPGGWLVEPEQRCRRDKQFVVQGVGNVTQQ
jgi:hypothetical protein